MIQESDNFIPYIAPVGKRADSKFRDLTGQRFHYLTVEQRVQNTDNGKSRWLCKCDCGRFKVFRTDHLLASKIKSCGCMVAYLVSTTERKEGNCRSIWNGIKERMTCPSTPFFKHYQKRGIRMCKGWFSSYQSFYDAMGEKPQNKSIDRKDNNGHYSCGQCEECRENGWPMNCRWATRTEQQRNRSNTVWLQFHGEKRALAALAEEYGICGNTVRYHLKRGKMPEEIFVMRMPAN